MPKTKAQKAEIVAVLTDKFRRMKAAAFSSIAGYTMEQANVLRAKGLESNVDVFVAKKTLLERAARDAGVELDHSALKGSILTAVSYGDEVSAAKLLKGLSKDNELVSLVSGVLEGKILSKAEVVQLAALPGKQELLQKLVGTLNAPVSGFVNVLAGNLRGLVTVLGAISKK